MDKKRKRIVPFLIYIAVTALILIAVYNLLHGTNYEVEGDTIYYYFPAEYSSGAISFNSIRSKERDGATVIFDTKWSDLYADIDSPDKVSVAAHRNDIGQNLYGSYYEDGKLGFIVYDMPLSDYSGSVRHYLFMNFYDEDKKRLEDAIAACAKNYAYDIAESIKEEFGDQRIGRIFLMYDRDDIDQLFIRVRIGTEEFILDDPDCIADDHPKLLLLSKGYVDCLDMLKAIVSSSDSSRCDDILQMVSEGIKEELLNEEYSENINRTDDFSVEIYGYGNKK
ncbi:MAG: hypothetical protein J1E40_10515 [Oscillospiraceae bacterium]|nr:hypothetical protein [Oscillospiraceae bacterium]